MEGHREGMETGMRILLIEDDTVLGAAVRDQIATDGQSVDWVMRLDEAGDAAKSTSYDLILLDLDLDGALPSDGKIRDIGDNPTRSDLIQPGAGGDEWGQRDRVQDP